MKKIFYSMMAVALCACSQSDVDDVVTPPQPENSGLKFEVIDNGFANEDGTRVSYGAYGSDAAYQAKFEDQDAIGIFAIDTKKGMANDPVTYNDKAMAPADNAYTVSNAKLTLMNGTWVLTDADGNTNVDFGNADLLFAYAPYDPNVTIPTGVNEDGGAKDGKPSFIQNADGTWDLFKRNCRFFVGSGWSTVIESEQAFKDNDRMGAVAKVPASNDEKITFNMIHMRGMIEVTMDKDITLTEMKLSHTAAFATPYIFATTASQKVYRVLTTEFRSGLTVYATITDQENGETITKKYKKVIPASDPGICSHMNIPYSRLVTIGANQTLEGVLKEKYGDDYATDPALISLRLAGTLQGANATSGDWATLRNLTKLQRLDMSALTNNTTIPGGWLMGAPVSATLAKLVLPNGLTTIETNALQVGEHTPLTNIELPATVTTIGQGVFYHCNNLSVRIPEGVQTIGQGAFDGVKAAYTDPSNIQELKISASVTSISSRAFANINQLSKVIFEAANPPATLDNTAFEGSNVVIFVPNKEYYYGNRLFPGKKVIVSGSEKKITLTADDYDSPYTYDGDGIGKEALCDGITGVSGNHWHNNYMNESITYDEWGVYIDITLPAKEAGYDLITGSFTTRFDNAGGAPRKVRLAVSNDGNTFTQVGEDFTVSTDIVPTGNPGGNKTVKFGPITVGTNKYVRFAVLEAGNGPTVLANQTIGMYAGSVNLAELTLYEPETWIEQ